MNVNLLLTLHAQGVHLTLAGNRLGFTVTDGAISAELAEKLKRERPALTEALRDPAETAYRVWEAAVAETSRRWTELYSDTADVPWVDAEWEYQLTERIGALIRAGDLAGTLEAVNEWREAWEELLARARNGEVGDLSDSVVRFSGHLSDSETESDNTNPLA